MEADSAALLFDFGEIGEFVHVGFDVVERVVVPRDRVEAGAFGLAAGDDGVGDAHNGGGVHAATEFGENWSIGTESALDGRGQDGAEVFFVFGVGAITDFLLRIEIPILADGMLSWSEEYR